MEKDKTYLFIGFYNNNNRYVLYILKLNKTDLLKNHSFFNYQS